MLDILEQALPSEVASLVFRFSAHPVASLMAGEILKYEAKQIRLQEFCKRKQRVDRSVNYAFYLYWSLGTKVAQGAKEGKMAREVVLENKHLTNMYY